jgi:predicted GH43/DUF377 family glycosyl hydrolase
LNLIDGKGDEHAIRFDEKFQDHSIEDGRLFLLNGKLMLSYVVAMATAGQLRCVVGYGELVREGGWRLARHYQPRYGQNDFSSRQKNWVPFEHKGALHFLYASSPEQAVLRVEGDSVVQVLKSKGAEWPYGEIRGGCILRLDGKLLRFFHSHTVVGPRESWIYRVGAAWLSPEPPFETVKVCTLPVLTGNEKWTQCKHWKANVVFPGGAVEVEGGWKLACGLNDCESALATIQLKDLNL